MAKDKWQRGQIETKPEAITLDINRHLRFVDSQLIRLEKDIEDSNPASVKDLVDYHRYAESMMFLAAVVESLR